MAAGIKLSMVTKIPAHPATATGCNKMYAYGLSGGAGGTAIKNSANNKNIKGTGREGNRLSLYVTAEKGKPTTVAREASMKLTIGPLEPMSNKASLFGGRDFCIITAPKVPSPKNSPIGGGPGIKYRGVALIPSLFAAILCPSSCSPNMAIKEIVKVAPPIIGSVKPSESKYPVMNVVPIVARNSIQLIRVLLFFAAGFGITLKTMRPSILRSTAIKFISSSF